MATKHDINYSSNSDPEKVAAEVAHLTDGAGRWSVSATKSGLEREFKFKTFKTTWAFMNLVAEEAGKKRHHPEWSNVYNTTFIRWTTHHPPGLSELDVQLAAFCDKQAQEMGELVPEPAHQSIQEKLMASEATEIASQASKSQEEVKAMEEESGVEEKGMCGLTERAVEAGGDCCVPKSARKTGGDVPEAEELYSKGP